MKRHLCAIGCNIGCRPDFVQSDLNCDAGRPCLATILQDIIQKQKSYALHLLAMVVSTLPVLIRLATAGLGN